MHSANMVADALCIVQNHKSVEAHQGRGLIFHKHVFSNKTVLKMRQGLVSSFLGGIDCFE